MKLEDLKVGMRVVFEKGNVCETGTIVEDENDCGLMFKSDKVNNYFHNHSSDFKCKYWYLEDDYDCEYIRKYEEPRLVGQIPLLDAIVLMRGDNNRRFEGIFGTIYKIENNKVLFSENGGISFIECDLSCSYILIEQVIEIKKPFNERIRVGDKYYTISCGISSGSLNINRYTFENDCGDNYFIERGNFFETEELAEEKAKLVRNKLDEIAQILKN